MSPERGEAAMAQPEFNRSSAIKIIARTLYDFANSAFAVVILGTIYASYDALAMVGNAHGEGDLWWGRVISASMALVALSSAARLVIPCALPRRDHASGAL